jgi:membrane-associated protease RseP (regulator of RpoE activity)
VKNTVSAPVALLVIALATAAAILYFSRAQPGEPAEPDVFVLPFAPPVEDAEVADLRRALLPMGVTVVHPPLTEDRRRGARLGSVSHNSPAQLAGLQGGDLVTRFDDTPIVQAFALAGMVGRAQPDESYTVVYRRAGEEHEATITGIHPQAGGRSRR